MNGNLSDKIQLVICDSRANIVQVLQIQWFRKHNLFSLYPTSCCVRCINMSKICQQYNICKKNCGTLQPSSRSMFWINSYLEKVAQYKKVSTRYHNSMEYNGGKYFETTIELFCLHSKIQIFFVIYIQTYILNVINKKNEFRI